MLKIGSHVGLSKPDYFLGAVQEALSYKANALMVFTGPPQNSIRTPLDQLKIKEAQALLKENDIPLEDVIIHAPYIINLGNTVNEELYQKSKDLLALEIERTKGLGAKYLVLHPGAHVKMGSEVGCAQIVKALDELLKNEHQVVVCLETMALKGSEIGSFKEIGSIIHQCKYKSQLGVCFDSCHTNDAGYNLTQIDEVLKQFDEEIGLEYLKVMHINDSYNGIGAHKDRHANIGYGLIGFETLCNIVHHPKLDNIVKILETPYINGKAPYMYEIESLKEQKFNEHLKEI